MGRLGSISDRMGCGASICCKREPLLPANRQGLVTPPDGRRGAGINKAAHGLRIDPVALTRKEAGMAETPMGKAAEEYRYYCPLCMCAPARPPCSPPHARSPVACPRGW